MNGNRKLAGFMDGIRFIHTADLHLDTPFKGLSNLNKDLGDLLKKASYRSFNRIVNLCINREADFLIIAGDSFDIEYKSLYAQLTFVSGLEKLKEYGIQVYIICGNHDPLGSWLKSLRLPENVFRFPSSEPERVIFEKHGTPAAEIVGMSYQEQEENRDLSLLYPKRDDAYPFSIAILHGTLGSPAEHEMYAPFKTENLSEKGFDYWALGHIHKREVIKESFPAIVYPGNPQGRDFGETGARGCYLVDLEKDKRPVLEFLPVNNVRFEGLEIDISEQQDVNGIVEKIEREKERLTGRAGLSGCLLRITLKGKTPLHTILKDSDEIENLIEYLNSNSIKQVDPFVWIDSIKRETVPCYDEEEIKRGDNFASEILRTADRYAGDPEAFEALFVHAEKGMGNRQVIQEISCLSKSERLSILESAKYRLIERLISEEEE